MKLNKKMKVQMTAVGNYEWVRENGTDLQISMFHKTECPKLFNS